ncbi:hypothetical protein VTK73DRAFT_5584 [Phialemonium thermophilum]|uniref:Uncharacterized protein n=1 Tax=Phialemonium thermophilum TaxID=223376 RepID=A0ABR3V184_9PEZI
MKEGVFGELVACVAGRRERGSSISNPSMVLRFLRRGCSLTADRMELSSAWVEVAVVVAAAAVVVFCELDLVHGFFLLLGAPSPRGGGSPSLCRLQGRRGRLASRLLLGLARQRQRLCGRRRRGAARRAFRARDAAEVLHDLPGQVGAVESVVAHGGGPLGVGIQRPLLGHPRYAPAVGFLLRRPILSLRLLLRLLSLLFFFLDHDDDLVLFLLLLLLRFRRLLDDRWHLLLLLPGPVAAHAPSAAAAAAALSLCLRPPLRRRLRLRPRRQPQRRLPLPHVAHPGVAVPLHPVVDHVGPHAARRPREVDKHHAPARLAVHRLGELLDQAGPAPATGRAAPAG